MNSEIHEDPIDTAELVVWTAVIASALTYFATKAEFREAFVETLVAIWAPVLGGLGIIVAFVAGAMFGAALVLYELGGDLGVADDETK